MKGLMVIRAASTMAAGVPQDRTNDITFHVVADNIGMTKGFSALAHHPRLRRIGYVSCYQLLSDSPKPKDPDLALDEDMDRVIPEAFVAYQKLTGGKGQIFGVSGSGLDRRFRGEGVGQRLYLELLKHLSKYHAVLCPNSAYEDGGTSGSAQRVWAKLKDHPAVVGTALCLKWVGPDHLLDQPVPSRRNHGWEDGRRTKRPNVQAAAMVERIVQRYQGSPSPRSF